MPRPRDAWAGLLLNHPPDKFHSTSNTVQVMHVIVPLVSPLWCRSREKGRALYSNALGVPKEGHFSAIVADGLAELGSLFVFHLSNCNSWRRWLLREEADCIKRNSLKEILLTTVLCLHPATPHQQQDAAGQACRLWGQRPGLKVLLCHLVSDGGWASYALGASSSLSLKCK